MKQHFSRFSFYYILCLIFILFGLTIIMLFPKADTVLALNNTESSALDWFFRNATKFGEWIGGLLLGIILIIKKELKYLAIMLIAVSITSSTTQLLKSTIYKDVQRPSALYGTELRPIDGVKQHKQYSFPSGHTTAAFCFATILALSLQTKTWQLLAAFWAIIVGVSRVYLGQHFPMDVVGGACIGLIFTTVIFLFLQGRLYGRWLDRKLFIH